MKNDLLNTLEKAKFSDDFLSYFQQNFPTEYQLKFDHPFHQDFEQNPLLLLSPTNRVFESIAQLTVLKEFYEMKGIASHHFYNSISDLKYRIDRFYKNNGQYDLMDRDIKWLSPLYRAEIFDLGSLRFQISNFSYQEIERQTYQYMPLAEKWKEKFPEGTPIITVHIAKDTDFRSEKIDESFTLARKFFTNYFSEHVYDFFVCRTWLLYRPLENLLDPESNILSFSKRFQIIAQNKNQKQALDRIYGTSDLEEIAQIPKNSSLARKAYKNLDLLGVAAGIIPK